MRLFIVFLFETILIETVYKEVVLKDNFAEDFVDEGKYEIGTHEQLYIQMISQPLISNTQLALIYIYFRNFIQIFIGY